MRCASRWLPRTEDSKQPEQAISRAKERTELKELSHDEQARKTRCRSVCFPFFLSLFQSLALPSPHSVCAPQVLSLSIAAPPHPPPHTTSLPVSRHPFLVSVSSDGRVSLLWSFSCTHLLPPPHRYAYIHVFSAVRLSFK